MIEEGRIALHGETVAQPAPLLASLDGLTVDGNPVAKPVSNRLYRFHKPAGTYYASPAPDKPALVSVRQAVKAGETLGINEALKRFNPIESEEIGRGEGKVKGGQKCYTEGGGVKE